MSQHPVIFKRLGQQEYIPVWEAMKKFTLERKPATTDEIWFVQHPPVYTLGLNGKDKHILQATDIPLVKIDRGGQITYHAPGQLVAYCMIDLRRCNYGVQEFVKRLESSIRKLLKSYNIDSHRVDKAPGVYVDNKKIAALGLRVKKQCTYHGLSLNVNMDLQPFKNINPCGYPGLDVCQLADYGVTDSVENTGNKLEPELINSIYSEQL